MSQRMLSIVLVAVTSLPALLAVGGCASGKPYGLTGQPQTGPSQGEINRRADEQRSPNFRRAVPSNVPPSYPA